MSTNVPGYCPMGCGQTLFAGSGGYITCSWVDCPNPTAVSDILEDQETEHVAVIEDGFGFTIKHPLKERLDDQLLTCDLHERLSEHFTGSMPFPQPGRYRVTRIDHEDAEAPSWSWVAVPA